MTLQYGFRVRNYYLIAGFYNTIAQNSHVIDKYVISVNGQSGIVVITTTELSEGSNLYFTEERMNQNFASQGSGSLTDSSTLVRASDEIIFDGNNAAGDKFKKKKRKAVKK